MPDYDSFEKLFTECSVWVADATSSGTVSSLTSLAKRESFASCASCASCASRKLNSSLVSFAPVSFAPEIDSALAHGGLKRGALHEFFSKDKDIQIPLSILSLLAIKSFASLKQDSGKYILWIGKNCWPAPHFLKTLSNSSSFLDRCLFIDPKSEKQALWAIESALRSSSIIAVISKIRSLSFLNSRRLALAAEKGNSLGLFVRNFKESSYPSAAMTRWLVEASPSSGTVNPGAVNSGAVNPISINPCFQLTLLKQKGGPLLPENWILEVAKDGSKVSTRIFSGMVGESCEKTDENADGNAGRNAVHSTRLQA